MRENFFKESRETIIQEHKLHADVLVVGGGAGYSGQSPFVDSLMAWFDKSTIAQEVENSIHCGEYIANKGYAAQVYG